MARVPSAARSAKKKSEENVPAIDASQMRLVEHIVQQVTLPGLGRPPRTDSEKRETFTALAYFRAAKLTYAECAKRLDVSESTIRNWLADPFYKTIQQELQDDTRQDGFTTIGSLIPRAISTLNQLLSDKSGFVRYKAAEEILKLAGMEMEQSHFTPENRDDIARIIEAIRLRNGNTGSNTPTQNINVQISLSAPNSGIALPEPDIVDALEEQEGESLLSKHQQWDLALQQQQMHSEYLQDLLPGGTLPLEPGEEEADQLSLLSRRRKPSVAPAFPGTPDSVGQPAVEPLLRSYSESEEEE